MLAALKTFLNDLVSGDHDPNRFEANDYRVATAALLVHAAVIDGQFTDAEREKLTDLVRRRFELDANAAAQLIEAATTAEREAVDLYRFTSLLNRTLDDEGRRRIVEMMWEVVLTDQRATEFEDNLIWRVADLLGVSGRERVMLKQQVAAGQAARAEDA
jgi:uncharacterized tellurite resistance protein B-like protein